MGTVPYHMYKDAVANELKRMPYVISIVIAYQLIEKYIESYRFCMRADLPVSLCAIDIYEEWQRKVHTPPVIRNLGPISTKACIVFFGK